MGTYLTDAVTKMYRFMQESSTGNTLINPDSDARNKELIQEGHRRFYRETGIGLRTVTITPIAEQQRYTIPLDVIVPEMRRVRFGLGFVNQPSAQAVTVVSDSTADTTQTVTVYGWTSNTDQTVKAVTGTVNGTTPVNITGTFGPLIKVSLSAACAGTLTVYLTAVGSTTGTITTLAAGTTYKYAETDMVPLVPVSTSYLDRYHEGWSSTASGTPEAYAIEAGKIVLYPRPETVTGYTLLFESAIIPYGTTSSSPAPLSGGVPIISDTDDWQLRTEFIDGPIRWAAYARIAETITYGDPEKEKLAAFNLAMYNDFVARQKAALVHVGAY